MADFFKAVADFFSLIYSVAGTVFDTLAQFFSQLARLFGYVAKAIVAISDLISFLPVDLKAIASAFIAVSIALVLIGRNSSSN